LQLTGSFLPVAAVQPCAGGHGISERVTAVDGLRRPMSARHGSSSHGYLRERAGRSRPARQGSSLS